jgi:hypothetical protein
MTGILCPVFIFLLWELCVQHRLRHSHIDTIRCKTKLELINFKVWKIAPYNQEDVVVQLLTVFMHVFVIKGFVSSFGLFPGVWGLIADFRNTVSVPKRRLLNTTSRGTTQKIIRNIWITAKAWNQEFVTNLEIFTCSWKCLLSVSRHSLFTHKIAQCESLQKHCNFPCREGYEHLFSGRLGRQFIAGIVKRFVQRHAFARPSTGRHSSGKHPVITSHSPRFVKNVSLSVLFSRIGNSHTFSFIQYSNDRSKASSKTVPPCRYMYTVYTHIRHSIERLVG